jgi:hypothetical protein
MASYGITGDELAQMIMADLERIDSAPEQSTSELMDWKLGSTLAQVIRSVAFAIEQNNAKLAEHIIAELRGDGTPPPRG